MTNVAASVPIGFLTTIMIVFCVLSVGAFSTLIFVYLRFQKFAMEQEAVINRLHDDFNAMCAAAVGVDSHLARLEERTRTLLQRQDQLEMQEPVGDNYQHAISLVRNGAGIDQLMSDCGLARGEAELLLLAGSMDRVN
ncbi:MAG: DUF2802 domain-containing protein [Gammaproteobacteria bacterium]|nr:DUF2802 domain-containing protein [Gammaproteobacteria bacterium]MDH5799170.1 DUF2802 domain-containing protein [Gammaproteobacteria bacterium]